MRDPLSRLLAPCLLPGLLLGLAACGDDAAEAAGDPSSTEGAADRPQVAFVTNGVADFWTFARRGAEAAGREFGVDVDVRMPPNGAADQQRIIEELLASGVDGIAVSPIDGENQAALINDAAGVTHVITHDSDAPGTARRCYVGMDNYFAGWSAGELVKEALPDGGKVAIVIGRLEQDNARRRRQGVIDCLYGRQRDPSRYDEPGSVRGISNKWVVVDTRTDQFDQARAKANVQELLTVYPDLDCFVGLFAYNPPIILSALEEAGRLDQVKVVAFDEDFATLDGIADGHVYATVVQGPYEYGYESVRILAGLARGDESVLPEGGFLNIPERVIRPDDVPEFRSKLERYLAGGE